MTLPPESGVFLGTLPPPARPGAFKEGSIPLVNVSIILPGFDSSSACCFGGASLRPLSSNCCSVLSLALNAITPAATPVPIAAAASGFFATNLKSIGMPRFNIVNVSFAMVPITVLTNKPRGVANNKNPASNAGHQSFTNCMTLLSLP